MPTEIERKFLVELARVPLPPRGIEIKQGYLPLSENVNTAVRVRVMGERAFEPETVEMATVQTEIRVAP